MVPPPVAAESPTPSPAPPRGDWRQQALLGSAVLSVLIAGGLWIYYAVQPPSEDELADKGAHSQQAAGEEPKKAESIPAPRGVPGHGAAAGSFLDSFVDKVLDPGEAPKGPALSNQELDQRLDTLLSLQDRIMNLERQLPPAPAGKEAKIDAKTLAELKKLSAQWSEQIAAFEKELRQARGSRPKDPVPQWLTGELLILVRGEPELILPLFQSAIEAGLGHARIWTSLARVQVEANQFELALQSALKAFEKSAQDVYVWNALARAAFAAETFKLVLDKLDQAFPKNLPDWAKLIRKDASGLQDLWQAEAHQRQADRNRDDLPRVRLIIEHRKFVLDKGKPTTKIDSTPGGEVVVELFEDQAPNTVANFLELVEKKFYDGTKFCLSDPAALVLGGCPLTKNADPADDGTGGPGYLIPDEFKLPRSRPHFRGSLCMANTGQPNSAGSQFYITLTPQPTMNGLFTVFGRVIKGQDIVDRITQGRTNLDVGPFGRIIPGDVLVRAEVIRKRPHVYTVKKLKAG